MKGISWPPKEAEKATDRVGPHASRYICAATPCYGYWQNEEACQGCIIEGRCLRASERKLEALAAELDEEEAKLRRKEEQKERRRRRLREQGLEDLLELADELDPNDVFWGDEEDPELGDEPIASTGNRMTLVMPQNGICPGCRGRILANESVTWIEGRGVYHHHCSSP